MLTLEWGVEGVHFFGANREDAASVSWPEGRSVPPITTSLRSVQRDEVPDGQLVCDVSCYQVVTLPLLHYGATAGYLVIERSIADSLKEFHLLSGADLAVLSEAKHPGAQTLLQLSRWSRAVSAITHEADIFQILEGMSTQVSLDQVLAGPRRIQFASEWYEVSAMPIAPGQTGAIPLMINRVTDQVRAIRDATKDSLILGLAGLVFSELILLFLMWGPMRRIQDVVYALPLLAEKSFSSLRSELPRLPADSGPRDEIDLMVNVIYDVSEQIEKLDEARTAAEHALRKSEQSLQLAQSMAKVTSWVGYPLAGGFQLGQGAGQIASVLEHVDSWSEFLELVHPDDRGRLRIAWRRGRAGGVMDIEFRLLTDGEYIDVHAVAEFGMAEPKRVLRASGMMQDITEMRVVQRALRNHSDHLEKEVAERTAELVDARNRAEKLAKNKSEFLANVSHEIRTPMSAVLGLSQMGMRDSENRRIAVTFEQILQSGEHLLKVVNDVLDLSKLEAGKFTVEANPFELRKVLGMCVDMLRPRAKEKSLQMQVNVPEDLPDWVRGDSFRLQQILINILSNAIKFTERGSVLLDVTYRLGTCYFKIRDTGIGLSQEQLRRLFVPFHQFENSLTRKHEGTGLGLSISNSLASMMGGEITVRSEPGVGSEFVLRLPLEAELDGAQMEQDVRVSSPSGVQRLEGVRVLVADDVRINRTVVEALLQAEGAFVTLVGNGAEATETVLRAGAGAFDIVLMDLQMPEMDGREATHTIRSTYPDLPIIGLTAHVSEEERKESLACGMNDQLVKPVMQDELVATILRHVIKGEPGLPEEVRIH